jgi:peptide/nickel transport system permease protein
VTGYLVRRLLWAAVVALGIATLVFVVLHLAPGDPANLLLGPRMRAETVAVLRARFGLDDPLLVQYGRWLAALFRGDLGMSFQQSRPVSAVLGAALPHTLLLAGLSLVVAFAGGVAVGVAQAMRHRGALDRGLSAISLAFYSMPPFWLALMLVLVFAVGADEWGWPIAFPPTGPRSVNADLMGLPERILDRAHHLVLPVAALALVMMAGISRHVRASMLESIHQDYVRTARAKGLPERTVIVRHALRNGLLPVITLAGLYLPLLFSGAVLVEEIFGFPGMGRVLVTAIGFRDYPVILGSGLLFSGMVVVGSLIADLLYAVADPRVRHGRSGP